MINKAAITAVNIADFFLCVVFKKIIKNQGESTAKTTLTPFLLAIFITYTTSSMATFFSVLKTIEVYFKSSRAHIKLCSKILIETRSAIK